ncbi:hypothetical protein B0F90DRAFT_1722087 [Multifurca ochricompacta]|uniref:Uncharacterized protein n=1 Tax=Multifurca ochricompacta TaxID=376703 RepID=A0AAD4M471_9AGAM|nr:hypothetical protein B0F90DRAFT_1722087 [Multifurca ochricompacta]
MASDETTRKDIHQRGRPLRRQRASMPMQDTESGLHPERMTTRKLQKERSMRIPAIENDMLNRIGVSKSGKKAVLRATRTKMGSRSRSPFKDLLSVMARTEDILQGPLGSGGGGGPAARRSSSTPRTSALASHGYRSISPVSSHLVDSPTASSSGVETRSKKKCAAGERGSVVVVVSSPSSKASYSPSDNPPPSLSSEKTLPTPSASVAIPGLSQPALVLDLPPVVDSSTSQKRPSVPIPDHNPPLLSDVDVQEERFQDQGEGRSAISSGRVHSDASSDTGSCPPIDAVRRESSNGGNNQKLGDAQMEDAANCCVESILPDFDFSTTANAAQATAMKESLLSQIEARNNNNGEKWNDLLGFIESLLPDEISELIKTAARAGRRARSRIMGGLMIDSDSDNGDGEDDDDTRSHENGQRPRLPSEEASVFNNSESDGEIPSMTLEWDIHSHSSRDKGKGKARANSPSPESPSSPTPVFASRTHVPIGSSSSGAFDGNPSASASASRKRSLSPGNASDDKPPIKRQKQERSPQKTIGVLSSPQQRKHRRPLRREGAFDFSKPPPPLPRWKDIHRYDDHDRLLAKRHLIHVDLVKSCLDEIHNSDVSSWRSRPPVAVTSDSSPGAGSSRGDRDGIALNGGPYTPRDKVVHDWTQRRNWMLRVEVQALQQRRRKRQQRRFASSSLDFPSLNNNDEYHARGSDLARCLKNKINRRRQRYHRRLVRRAHRLGEEAPPPPPPLDTTRELWDEEAEFEASWNALPSSLVQPPLPLLSSGSPTRGQEAVASTSEFETGDITEPDTDYEEGWDDDDWLRPNFQKDYSVRLGTTQYQVEPNFWTIY